MGASLLGKMSSLVEEERWRELIELASGSLGRDPANDGLILFFRATGHLSEGQVEQALDDLGRSTELDASYAPAWAVLGSRYHDDGNYGSGGDRAYRQAETALRRALERGRPFDAVIMDLTVPGAMGGQTAIRYLRELDPEVKAVVISGYSNDPVLANYRAYGFQGRISKPFTTEILGRALSRVMATGRVAGDSVPAPAGE